MTDEQTVHGPRIVRVRKAQKGPGKVVAHAASQADADQMATILKADGATDVVITPYDAPEIVTFDQWKKNTEKKREQDKARAALLAELNEKYGADQLADLGIKA